MFFLSRQATAKQATQKIAASLLAFTLMGSLHPMKVAAQKSSNPYTPTLNPNVDQNNAFVEVPINKSKIIHLNAPLSRISVSNPEMLGVVILSPTEIQLLGKQVGGCSVLIWTEKSGDSLLNIDVSIHRDVSTLAQKIKSIDPGIIVKPIPAEDSVILMGVAGSKENAQLVLDLAKAFFSASSAASSSSSGGSSSSSAPVVNSSNSVGTTSISASTGPKIINMIRVPGQPVTKAEMVEEKLKQINKNITLTIAPGYGDVEKAILSGKVRNASEVSKALNLASVFYGTPGIKLLTGPGGNLVPPSNAQQEVSGFTTDNTSGSRLIGNLDKNILQGSVLTDATGNVISMLEVAQRPQVRCNIKILEVRKDVNFQSGVNTLLTDGNIRAATYGSTNGLSSVASVFNQITGASRGEFAIRFGNDLATYVGGLVTDGKARILAEPNIITTSGEPGTFLAGGEFPIPVSNTNGQVNVVFKEFGIRLNVLPTVTERGSIHMQVSPEVSTLDPTSGITLTGITIPGLRSRRSQAVIEMHEGDNFVLGGLYNEDMNESVSKTPLLGQLPIIGELFKSRSYRKAETELVIIIHPEIIRDMDDPIEDETASSTEIQLRKNSMTLPVNTQPKTITNYSSTNYSSVPVIPYGQKTPKSLEENYKVGKQIAPENNELTAPKSMQLYNKKALRVASVDKSLTKLFDDSDNLNQPSPAIIMNAIQPVINDSFKDFYNQIQKAKSNRLNVLKSSGLMNFSQIFLTLAPQDEMVSIAEPVEDENYNQLVELILGDRFDRNPVSAIHF